MVLGMCVCSSIGGVRHAGRFGPVVRADWGSVVSSIRVQNWGHGVSGRSMLWAPGALTMVLVFLCVLRLFFF